MSKYHPDYLEKIKSGSNLNEKNDCAVIALSLVTEQSYEKIHSLLSEIGRKNNKPTKLYKTLHILKKFNEYRKIFLVEKRKQYPPRYKNKSITIKSIEEYPHLWQGTYLIVLSEHIFAVRNGKVLDWTRGLSKRINSIYKIEK